LTADEWLSLGEAADLLGVHPGTVRNWSNEGLLPVHRTQGGHRRYRRSEVELWMQSRQAKRPVDASLVIQNALRNTRFRVGEGRLQSEPWYGKLDEEARDQYRLSGRTMLQGMINYLNASDDQADAEAQGLGFEYAARGWRCGLSSSEATHAFLFFRNVLIESMLNVYEAAAVQSPYAWSEMFRRLNRFTNQILVVLLETYETFQRAER
jgi:excisionase family DNA binding protein